MDFLVYISLFKKNIHINEIVSDAPQLKKFSKMYMDEEKLNLNFHHVGHRSSRSNKAPKTDRSATCNILIDDDMSESSSATVL